MNRWVDGCRPAPEADARRHVRDRAGPAQGATILAEGQPFLGGEINAVLVPDGNAVSKEARLTG